MDITDDIKAAANHVKNNIQNDEDRFEFMSKLRDYMNQNNISYEEMSYNDLEPFLIKLSE